MKKAAAHYCLFIVLLLASCGKHKETCYDSIMNQGETSTDCGGPCKACPTCSDGIMNGHEQAVDCGGSECATCGTSDDGFKNRDETGVDCGGAYCIPCELAFCNVPSQTGTIGYIPHNNGNEYFTFISADSDSLAKDGDVKFSVGADFVHHDTVFDACRGFNAMFYGATILHMPVGSVQIFKTITPDDAATNNDKAPSFFNNKCVIQLNTSIITMFIQAGEAVYVTKTGTGANAYTIRFCHLPVPKESKYQLDTDFSANLEFTIKK